MAKNEERTITLHIYTDAMQAQIMQEKLKARGIDGFINDKNVLGMDPIAGVELKVFEKDKVEAEKILKE